MGVYGIEKKFGEKSKVFSIRVPESQFETIKEIVYDFIDCYNKDNLQTIKTTQNGIEEIISVYLDVYDRLKYRTDKETISIGRRTGFPKDKTLSTSEYYAILKNHNLNLIDDLIAKFPIERKTPTKTLTEEKKEEALRKAYDRKTSYVAPKPYHKPLPELGTLKYRKDINKSIRKAMKRK